MKKLINNSIIKNCCFCKDTYTGYGNNPSPLYDDFTVNLDAIDGNGFLVFSDEQIDAKCCDSCNTKLVLPFKMRLIFGGRVFIASQEFKDIQSKWGYKNPSLLRDEKIQSFL